MQSGLLVLKKSLEEKEANVYYCRFCVPIRNKLKFLGEVEKLLRKKQREGWAGKGLVECEVTGASLDDEGKGLTSTFPSTNGERNLTSRFSQEGTTEMCHTHVVSLEVT